MPPCECLWLKASAWVRNKTQRESTGILLQPEIDLMLSLRGVEKESCTRYIAHHIPHPLSHTLPAAVWHCCCHFFPLLHFAKLLVLLFLLLSWKNKSMLIDLFEIKRERENLNATLCACIENCFEKTIQSSSNWFTPCRCTLLWTTVRTESTSHRPRKSVPFLA